MAMSFGRGRARSHWGNIWHQVLQLLFFKNKKKWNSYRDNRGYSEIIRSSAYGFGGWWEKCAIILPYEEIAW